MILQRKIDGDFLEEITGTSFKEITDNPAILKGTIIQDTGFVATSPNQNSTFSPLGNKLSDSAEANSL